MDSISKKIILLGGAIVFVLLIFLAIVYFPLISQINTSESHSSTSTPGASSMSIIPRNAFLETVPSGNGLDTNNSNSDLENSGGTFSNTEPVPNNSLSLPEVSNSEINLKVPTAVPPVSILQKAAPNNSLSLPEVSNSEIKIDSAGVATVYDYFKYFNSHYKEASFEIDQYNNVLKDKNGVVLFVGDLIQKAIDDDNFAEVRDSLVVQRNFAAADVNYMKSIGVTGGAIAFDKQAIGSEELTLNLINKALDVSYGKLSKDDFKQFYAEYKESIQAEYQSLLAQTVFPDIAVANKSWVDDFLNFVSTKAYAGGDQMFGGKITAIIPCVCDAANLVVVGPPSPASVFVPWVFLATPLFYEFKVQAVGVWWLGLHSPISVPCLSTPPDCAPAGEGNPIIMTGTSAS